ncbi:MAG: DUF1638 domain-containing protein [Caldilinea sp. CFX5]|nr:DUF1638 domain-containing protein [Caldilinea sp. CFX5]
MRLKCLSCEALTRMVYLCAAGSPHLVDVELVRIGLHNEPINLRVLLQQKIDALSRKDFDAVVLAYGLCGQATLGLVAKEIPIVIPRAHDCITLFLGSRARYQEQFESNPGTYWYSLDYIERKEASGTFVVLGASVDSTNMQSKYEEYVAKYGADNADYLMEVMGAWQSHYNRAAYIDLGVGNGVQLEAQTRQEAANRGWQFERLTGNMTLIRRLLDGDWDQDFLVIQPGQQVAMSYDEDVIMCRTHQ